jgi:inorganic pyrophosphatase
MSSREKKKPARQQKEIDIVVETPRGSRNKYSFDPKTEQFRLDKILPAGMSFPWDFGFLPGTKAEDGDPTDVLLLMDDPCFPGCVVTSRLLGIIQAEQEEDGEMVRNDRLLAVAAYPNSYSGYEHISDLPERLVRDIGEFFTNYHRLLGGKFRVIGVAGPEQARRRIERQKKAA